MRVGFPRFAGHGAGRREVHCSLEKNCQQGLINYRAYANGGRLSSSVKVANNASSNAR